MQKYRGAFKIHNVEENCRQEKKKAGKHLAAGERMMKRDWDAGVRDRPEPGKVSGLAADKQTMFTGVLYFFTAAAAAQMAIRGKIRLFTQREKKKKKKVFSEDVYCSWESLCFRAASRVFTSDDGDVTRYAISGASQKLSHFCESECCEKRRTWRPASPVTVLLYLNEEIIQHEIKQIKRILIKTWFSWMQVKIVFTFFLPIEKVSLNIFYSEFFSLLRRRK